MISAIEGLPKSRHFRLEQAAEGVYAAIITPGAGALGNAAIVDLGDRTLVVDTFLTPQAAGDLRAAAEQLTGHGVAYVVNTHFHADHIGGNQAFAGATIIATERTRELIEGRIALLREQAAEYPQHVRELEESLTREQDPRKRAELEADVGDMREFVDALPTLDPQLPNLLFAERLVLRGSARAVEVLSYGGGHTPSDAFLYLPAEHVAIMGDLCGVQTHMALRFGDAAEWVRILERVEALDIEAVIPGHGPVGSRADLAAMRQYLADLQRLADEAVAEGLAPEQATTIAMPEQYQPWGFYSGFWTNVQLLIERHGRE
jgi:glyoxylase-like metal-dependent hydrolase (beta-lactamase superfamily II)